MKSVLAMSVLLASSLVFASGPYDQEIPPGTKIQYDSWCQGDRLMTENRDGEVYALADCSELSEYTRCVEKTAKKGEWTIVRATCE